MKRRNFIKSIIGGGFLTGSGLLSVSACGKRSVAKYDLLDKAAAQPVLKRQLFSSPVNIKSLDLLHYKGNFIAVVRSADGAEGYAVSNNAHMKYMYPLLLSELKPFFLNKDARDLDELVDGAYIYDSNYKLQGLALWIPLATIEFAILDMLGQIAKKPVYELFGKKYLDKVAVYQANNYRGKTARESIELIKQNVESSGAKAVKFKIGGRMSNNADYPPGRTEKLIPLVRETFGDNMTIYADSNGSYTVDKAIEIGKILQQYNIDFYEEPCPFDWYEETKQVADVLTIPIAGGEQESSLHNFRWLIGNRAVQIVQPDLFYFGGIVRSTRVARMAEQAGLSCIPHISGSGLGYLYMVHFVAGIPNAGPFHEFKGFNKNIPFFCDSSTLKSENGEVTVPGGPGWGITIDPDYLKKFTQVNLIY